MSAFGGFGRCTAGSYDASGSINFLWLPCKSLGSTQTPQVELTQAATSETLQQPVEDVNPRLVGDLNPKLCRTCLKALIHRERPGNRCRVTIAGALNHSLCLIRGSAICITPTVFYDVLSLLKNTHPGPDRVRTRCSCKFIFVPLFTFGSRYKTAEFHDELLKGRRSLHIAAAYGTKGQRWWWWWGGGWGKGGFVFPQDEQRRIGSPRHLIWRLRLTLRSFVFLSLEHNRVCPAVSTLSK